MAPMPIKPIRSAIMSSHLNIIHQSEYGLTS
jgi:hypothetical protein